MMVKTAQSSFIQKTLGVCGENARIRNTRIPIWTLVSFRKLGAPDSELLESYPSLTHDDLDLAWSYYSENQVEIDRAIAAQDLDNEEC